VSQIRVQRAAGILSIYVLTLAYGGISQTSTGYRLRPGKTNSDGFPITAAQLCFGSENSEHCYSPPDQDPPFGANPQSQPIKLSTGTELVLFTAESSAGGSGSLTILALVEDRNGQALNLLPKVVVSNQSEYALWNLSEISAMPVLVTADFLWTDGETHFSSHHYRIRAYVYNKQVGRYLEQVQFPTAKKYPGLDDVDNIHVLAPERSGIVTKLKQR